MSKTRTLFLWQLGSSIHQINAWSQTSMSLLSSVDDIISLTPYFGDP